MTGLHVAVVGLTFGEDFVPLYLAHPQVSRVTLVDTDSERLRRVGEKFHIADRAADLAEVLTDPSLDRTLRLDAEQGLPAVSLSRGPASNLYWTLAQLVAHHTVGGCDLRPGDLLGTGTISTPDDSGLGSLLELTRGGAQAITLPTGETRTFLQDGDELTIAARAQADGRVSIGFGECRGVIEPAL